MKSVTVKSDGTVSGTTITLEGVPLQGIRGLRFEHEATELPRIELDLCLAEVEVKGAAVFYATDPVTGETKELQRLEFKDGSQWP